MKADQSKKGVADSAAVGAEGALEGAAAGVSGVNPAGSFVSLLKPPARISGQGTRESGRVEEYQGAMITVPKVVWDLLRITDIALVIVGTAFGIGALWLLTRLVCG